MQATAKELQSLISKYSLLLDGMPEDALAFKSAPGKWSKKEILGHLIDSAQNNIRRFIVAQYEDNPAIVYNQDDWVRINNYQNWDWRQLVQLWRLQNRQAVHILENSVDAGSRQCTTQELHTIEWLAKDYVKHLLHHLHQVLDLEPVSYP
jgi:hypothetical protein